MKLNPLSLAQQLALFRTELDRLTSLGDISTICQWAEERLSWTHQETLRLLHHFGCSQQKSDGIHCWRCGQWNSVPEDFYVVIQAMDARDSSINSSIN